MSSYTTEVRFICEHYAGFTESQPLTEVNNIINKAIPKIFTSQFPIFDENYRNVICAKILKHYYTREICEETVGLWKLRLNTKMAEIMPYFNMLYKSELLDFNPLYDTDLETTNNANKQETVNRTAKDITDRDEKRDTSSSTTVKSDSSENGTTTNTDTKRDAYSETPQGGLQGVEDGTYLTNARKITDDKNETRTNTANTSNTGTETKEDTFTEDTTVDRTDNSKLNNTEQYINHVVGKSGGASYSKLLQEFRETFINIDMMVIDSLADLFFNLW